MICRSPKFENLWTLRKTARFFLDFVVIDLANSVTIRLNNKAASSLGIRIINRLEFYPSSRNNEEYSRLAYQSQKL
jgi:hypothetical protein